MSAWVTLPHFLLALVGAILVGVQAYRSTLPAQKEGDPVNEDSRQLFRFASMASFGVFLLALAVIAALDFRLVHIARSAW